MKRNMKKGLSVLMTAAMVAGLLQGQSNLLTVQAEEDTAAEQSATIQLTDEDVATLTGETSQTRTSVHDPSVVSDGNGTYYIFGSHMGVSKSTDLENWTSVTSESTTSSLFGDANGNVVSYETAFTQNAYTDLVTINDADGNAYQVDFGSYDAAAWISENTVSGNMWAPDVIYNQTTGKWSMYLSLNGATWNSTIILLTADNIEGPYVYQGPVVFSGFSTSDSSKSYKDTDLDLVIGEQDELPEKYQKIADSTWGTYWPHAIDPCVFYDADGKLWMSYGSWSGGIYMLELDETTGLRDYTVRYADTYDELEASVTSDPYFGTKIAGGYYVSGEGSYIQQIGSYYYLFMSYGFYSPEGGYNMRVFRSETPDGPYTDEDGNSAIYSKYIMNYSSTNANNNIGMKLMGNYKWDTMDVAEVAQGHNSVVVDDDGKAYVVYHTKFADGTASHEIRVHQLFTNEDGWLVAAPYEYSGETLSATGYSADEVTGQYDVIIHEYQIDYASLAYETPIAVTLNADGTITGDKTGTWSMTDGTAYATLVIDGTEYKGVFTEQVIDGSNITTMCFTVVSADGLSIWGSGEPTDDAVVAQNAADSSIVVPSNTYSDITLSTEGLNGAVISWSSSNTEVLSNDGKVTTPAEDTVVTLTETISKGDYFYQKEYQVNVIATPQNDTDSVLLASYFTDDPQDLSTALDGSLSVANPFYYGSNNGLDLSGGVTIEFDVESTGDVHVLGTILAFLANGGSNGRLYFTPGSYLGYNAAGSYYDANLNNYTLVNDYIGTGGHVAINLTQTGFTVSVNDEVAYTEEILSTDNGAGTVTSYKKVLDWLSGSADTLYFGYGSWWSTAGSDEANVTISNVECYVGPTTEVISEEEDTDTVFYTKDSVELTSTSDMTTEDNPFYGKNIDAFYAEYTINFADEAAMNGWDGIFSFYNSSTGGRVSIQTAPYVCYNDGAGNWMDINQPGADGATDAAASSEKGTDVKVTLSIDKNGAVFTVNGEEIAVSMNSSGVGYDDLLSYITSCDQLTWGVGAATSAYWNTELCTLKEVVLASGKVEKVSKTFDDTTLATSSDVTVYDNPFYGMEVQTTDLSFVMNLAEGAAQTGWDGVMSFYNSTTGGRVSIEIAPYICYNEATGNWIDFNNPNLDNSDLVILNQETGVDYTYTMHMDGSDVTMTVDGTAVNYDKDGSGATYAEMMAFIGTCDQFTIGVGNAQTAYWTTEVCDLSDILVEGYAIVKSDSTDTDDKGDTEDKEDGDEEDDTEVAAPELTMDSLTLATDADQTVIDNPFKDAAFDTLSVEYTVNFSEDAVKTGWDGLFSFYNSSTGARVSFESAPYVCFNDANGAYLDLNNPDTEGVTNAIKAYDLQAGVDYTFNIVVNKEEAVMYLNGVKFAVTEAGSGATYEDLLNCVAGCDQFTWGVGAQASAYWNTELCTLSNVSITTKAPATETYTKDSISLTESSAQKVEANPYYGKTLDKLHLEYTINWSEDAAKNGWDGLFSFYNSTTGGRVSVQSGAYICYNDANGSWMDLNQPGAGGTNAATDLGIEPGTEAVLTMDITSDAVTMTVNGEKLTLAESSSGVTYADLLNYITECDQLTLGVGTAQSAYWNSELCELTNLKMVSNVLNVESAGNGSVSSTGTADAATITAVPDDNYEFAGWYAGSILLGTDSTMELAVCKDVTVTAQFTEIPSKISAEYKTVQHWGNYVIGSVTLTNVSEDTLKSWSIDFDYAGKITSLWNANLDGQQDGVVSVSAPKWNKTLKAGAATTFYFTAKITDKKDIPDAEHFVLTSEEVVDAPEIQYELSVKKLCQWKKGYTASLIIKNTGDTMIDDWTIEFDYDDEITSIWGGRIVSHEGTHYVVTNCSYNSDIRAGGFTAIGFAATPANKADKSTAEISNQKMHSVVKR